MIQPIETLRRLCLDVYNPGKTPTNTSDQKLISEINFDVDLAPDGWIRVSLMDIPGGTVHASSIVDQYYYFDYETGYNGAAYYNKASHILVLACAGVEINPLVDGPKESLEDSEDLFTAATDMGDDQFQSALYFQQQVLLALQPMLKQQGLSSPGRVVYAGWSLGGATASLLAAHSGVETVGNGEYLASAVTFNSIGVKKLLPLIKQPEGLYPNVVNYLTKTDFWSNLGEPIGTTWYVPGPPFAGQSLTQRLDHDFILSHQLDHMTNLDTRTDVSKVNDYSMARYYHDIGQDAGSLGEFVQKLSQALIVDKLHLSSFVSGHLKL